MTVGRRPAGRRPDGHDRARAQAQTPKKGGVLKVAVLGDPPTLDAHWTTANFVEIITQHIYESLYTLDQNYQPIPVLAEGSRGERGRAHLHDQAAPGHPVPQRKEMTSEDVVASLKRWGGYAAQAKAMWTSVEACGRRQIHGGDQAQGEVGHRADLPGQRQQLLRHLSQGDRREVSDAGQGHRVHRHGPFKFVEWKPDVHIRMVRYDDYKPRAEPANGYGGRKVAYVDEIRWIPMPEVATRVAASSRARWTSPTISRPWPTIGSRTTRSFGRSSCGRTRWAMGVFNKKDGLMTNVKLRQAVQAAIDIEPVMRAAVGNPVFYRLDSALAFTEQAAWHSKAGGDAYNQRNKDKAKKLLQEAGYKGEPIRFLTTTEYEWMYNVALVTKQQLEDVGMTVDLQVVDWATLVQRRNNEKMYDIFTTGMTLVPDPTQHPYLRCDWPGWTCDEAITSRMDAIRKEPDPAKRKALWEEVHRTFYERVPVIRYGDLFGLRAMQATVKGFNEKMAFPRFYNVWLDK
jgi:peptide/nickel transport system substrate-binding protein